VAIQVTPIPAFQDNYLWLLDNSRFAAVVDPGDAEPVLRHLQAHKLDLSAILVTHHHGDHIGGVAELLERYPVPVFGPAEEDIPDLTHRLREGSSITVPGLDITFSVLEVPGHTAGHIAYVGNGMLFCGDTLFACGCGRLFEGTPAQMTTSLGKLAALSGDTKVYCAHEYTLSNIRFAEAVEPGNQALRERKIRESLKREEGIPTLPSSIALECDTNPFLRWSAPEVIAAAERAAGRKLHQPQEVFGALREWKNRF
jgi:hydroxyacylglutathione hydrolase